MWASRTLMIRWTFWAGGMPAPPWWEITNFCLSRTARIGKSRMCSERRKRGRPSVKKVAADVNRLKLLPPDENERIHVRCYAQNSAATFSCRTARDFSSGCGKLIIAGLPMRRIICGENDRLHGDKLRDIILTCKRLN